MARRCFAVDAINETSVIASTNGRTTYGDRLRVRFTKDNCSMGNLFTTVYTTSNNPDLKNFEDIDVNANFMGFNISCKCFVYQTISNWSYVVGRFGLGKKRNSTKRFQ